MVWLSGARRYAQALDPTRFHHVHSLVTDGLVSPEGSFLPLPCSDPVQIMRLFRYKLLDTLLAQDKITPRLVEILLSWRHPGFSVYQGEPIAPDDHETRQRLARYMLPSARRTRSSALSSRNRPGRLLCQES